MRGRGASLAGQAEPDHRLAGDDAGPVDFPCQRDGLANHLRIVAIDGLPVPTARLEAAPLVLRSGQVGRAIDGDTVVVEEKDQPAEIKMPSQGGGLVGKPLHQAAVAGQHIGVVIDEIGAVTFSQHPFRERHADCHTEALAERTGGRLDANRWIVFGMPGVLLPSRRKRRISSRVIAS